MLPTTLISLEDSRVSVASKLVPGLIFVLVCFSIVFLWGLSPVVPVLLGPLGLFYGPSNPLPGSPEYLRLLPPKSSPHKM